MKNIIAFTLFVFISKFIYAQTTEPCNYRKISTNFEESNNIPLCGDGTPIRLLNWVASQWDWQTSGLPPNGSSIISNPISTPGSLNLQNLQQSDPSLMDILPEDGWELLAYNFKNLFSQFI